MKTNCEYCSIEIERTPYQINRAKHSTCSKECQAALQTKLSKITIHCKQCKSKIEKRKGDVHKFCSQSCAATFNNINKLKKFSNCLWCNSVIALGNKYCNNDECFHSHRHDKRLTEYNQGNHTGLGKNFFKKMVTDRDGYTCNCCGLYEWMGKSIVLELEHIDGNSENNKEDNLILLCPNCHSQTPTFKGANRGNGRKDRREIYRKGVKAE